MSQETCRSKRRRMLTAVMMTSASAAFSHTPFVWRSPRLSSSAMAGASSFAWTTYTFVSGSDLDTEALGRFAGGGEDEEDADAESDCVGLEPGRLKGMLESRRIGQEYVAVASLGRAKQPGRARLHRRRPQTLGNSDDVDGRV